MNKFHKLLFELTKKTGKGSGTISPCCASHISHPMDKGLFLSIYIQFLKIKSSKITKLLQYYSVFFSIVQTGLLHMN